MSFRESTRQWWFRVADYRCQYEYYLEESGWVNCGHPAAHLHHIIGEAETLLSGENPNDNVALPVCQDHHVRNEGEILGEPDASFHPDMAQAYKDYKEWKQRAQHMADIMGKRTIDYSDSPFAQTARGHREMVHNGERYISGDEGTDQYYIDKMLAMAVRYLAENPDDPKPRVKAHPETDYTKRKRWWSG